MEDRELDIRLEGLKGDVTQVRDQLFDVMQPLEHADTITPREFRIYEHLVKAFESLALALDEIRQALE